MWVAILATCLFTALAVWILDAWMQWVAEAHPQAPAGGTSHGAATATAGGAHNSKADAQQHGKQHLGLLRTTCYTLGQPVQARDLMGDVRSLPSVVVVLCFSLVMLICIQLYTANTGEGVAALCSK